VSRPTPFDLFFRDLVAELDAIRGERDRMTFARDPDVQRLLQRIESPELIEQAPEAAPQYLTALYAAWRFHATGARVVSVDRATLEPVLDEQPPTSMPDVPGGACYLQLPHQWFWGQVAEEAPHEPLDGMFVTPSRRGDELVVVAVLGLRPERDGFSQISVIAHPDDLRAAPGLARTDRFAPVLAGGARAGVRSVVSPAELLLLTHLALTRGAG